MREKVVEVGAENRTLRQQKQDVSVLFHFTLLPVSRSRSR